MRNAHKLLIIKPEGNRPIRKSRCRLDDNIKTYPIETVWNRGLYSIGSTQGPKGGFHENDNEFLGPMKGGEFVDELSDC